MTLQLEVPPIGELFAFHGIHALCAVSDDNKKIAATHAAVCLVHGSNPVWGLWNVRGQFVRFHGSKAEIKATYPHLVWRRWMAEWRLTSTDRALADAKKRIAYLEAKLGQRIERPEEERTA